MPRSFSPVMSLGILSVAAQRENQQLLSDLLLVIALIVFVWLAFSNLRVFSKLASSALVLFTLVAASGVLAVRAVGILTGATYVFAALALAGWVLAIVASGRAYHSEPAPPSWNVSGSWLLATVGTQSLAISAATTGFETLGLGFWILGLATYVVVIAIIIERLLRRRLKFAPDLWIAMGGLAITTVAAVDLSAGAAVVTWVAALAWIPFLLVGELLEAHRWLRLEYDLLRWSTIFPLGMISLATFDVAPLVSPALVRVAEVFLWTGLALTAFHAFAWVRSGGVRPATEFREGG